MNAAVDDMDWLLQGEPAPAPAPAPAPPAETPVPDKPSAPSDPVTYADKKPNIFITGPSGSGKSTSLRNLNPERTIILSTEHRTLPFPGARKFKMVVQVKSFASFKQIFIRALLSDKADVVVLESFTSLAEFAYAEIVRHVERKGNNVMDAWAVYKDQLHDILLLSKQATNKHVVFVGIDSIIQDEQQRIIRTIDCQGSLRGKIEKEFDCVLWTKALDAAPGSDQSREYVFATNGIEKSKTPMGMFKDEYIPNDIAAVIARCESYANEE